MIIATEIPTRRLTEYRLTDGPTVAIAWAGTRRDIARFRASLFPSERRDFDYGRLPDGRYVTGAYRVILALTA